MDEREEELESRSVGRYEALRGKPLLRDCNVDIEENWKDREELTTLNRSIPRRGKGGYACGQTPAQRKKG